MKCWKRPLAGIADKFLGVEPRRLADFLPRRVAQTAAQIRKHSPPLEVKWGLNTTLGERMFGPLVLQPSGPWQALWE